MLFWCEIADVEIVQAMLLGASVGSMIRLLFGIHGTQKKSSSLCP